MWLGKIGREFKNWARVTCKILRQVLTINWSWRIWRKTFSNPHKNNTLWPRNKKSWTNTHPRTSRTSWTGGDRNPSNITRTANYTSTSNPPKSTFRKPTSPRMSTLPSIARLIRFLCTVGKIRGRLFLPHGVRRPRRSCWRAWGIWTFSSWLVSEMRPVALISSGIRSICQKFKIKGLGSPMSLA